MLDPARPVRKIPAKASLVLSRNTTTGDSKTAFEVWRYQFFLRVDLDGDGVRVQYRIVQLAPGGESGSNAQPVISARASQSRSRAAARARARAARANSSIPAGTRKAVRVDATGPCAFC